MRRRSNKSPWSGVLGLIGAGAAGWIVWNREPSLLTELTVISLVGSAIFLIMSTVTKNKKTCGLVTACVVGLAVFNRAGILDLTSGALLMAVLGLIALIN